jgi:hypothetical protein
MNAELGCIGVGVLGRLVGEGGGGR